MLHVAFSFRCPSVTVPLKCITYFPTPPLCTSLFLSFIGQRSEAFLRLPICHSKTRLNCGYVILDLLYGQTFPLEFSVKSLGHSIYTICTISYSISNPDNLIHTRYNQQNYKMPKSGMKSAKGKMHTSAESIFIL